MLLLYWSQVCVYWRPSSGTPLKSQSHNQIELLKNDLSSISVAPQDWSNSPSLWRRRVQTSQIWGKVISYITKVSHSYQPERPRTGKMLQVFMFNSLKIKENQKGQISIKLPWGISDLSTSFQIYPLYYVSRWSLPTHLGLYHQWNPYIQVGTYN